jgi:hypothetical protein
LLSSLIEKRSSSFEFASKKKGFLSRATNGFSICSAGEFLEIFETKKKTAAQSLFHIVGAFQLTGSKTAAPNVSDQRCAVPDTRAAK